MEITEYIKPELIVVALALYFLDMALRKSSVIQDKYIIFLTGLAGILICSLYVFATCECGGGKRCGDGGIYGGHSGNRSYRGKCLCKTDHWADQ